MAVLDGTEGPTFDEVRDESLTFAPDGRLAYAAREGDRWFLVLDGVRGEGFEVIDSTTLAFSSQGQRVAYAARQGDDWFVVGGRGGERSLSSGWGQRVCFAFGPDGQSFAYAARQNNRWFVVTDGHRSRAWAEVALTGDTGIIYEDPGRIRYLALLGDTVYRVVERVPDAPPALLP